MTMNAVPVCSPWLLCISLLAVGLTVSVTSAAECNPIVATVVSVQGRVEVRRVNLEQWQPVRLNDIFCAGDRIRVGDESQADIALANRAVLRLDQNTTIILGGIQKDQTVPVVLIKGASNGFTRPIRAAGEGALSVKAGVGGAEGWIRIGNTQADVVSKNEERFFLSGRQSIVSPKGQVLR